MEGIIQGTKTFNNSDLKLQHLTRRRTDIKDVGESTLTVGEQTVGETTRRRNDRIPRSETDPVSRATSWLIGWVMVYKQDCLMVKMTRHRYKLIC